MSISPIRTGRRAALPAIFLAGALLASACGGPPGQGTYPVRDIQIIVPYPAGSSIDTTTRALAEVINDQGTLGKRVQVVNREGGAGSVGTTATLNAKPDGYTVGVLPDGPLTLVPHTEEVSYDPENISVLNEVTISPVLFVVPEDSPYRDLGDLIDAAKARPGTITLGEGPLNYAVPAEKFEQLTDTRFQHIAFDGDQATTTALLGDNLDVGVMQLAGAFAQLRSGKVRALAIASAERTDLAPDIPTFREQDVALEWEAYNVVVAPPELPGAVATKLSDVFGSAVRSEAFTKAARDLGLVVSGAGGAAAEKRLTDKSAAAADLLAPAQ
ncbi:tripartite-type tricarboxylate transporter receptor subunit TctC [Prauserella shujinwangii]|uniref:Tripartite-type tricarboxylate transporter receptor subunit TctC n=1 Tax=Prauserella shujinwangii TaxID=1453103 RepID=A0A2T0LSN0_9PSEU|nr:tripartite tricarboxylate transporter substrate binding protein [Prauserella shujinwangii]PRX46677.1 tripartite-type tricarboxylate transporter receptor subunit TctC [Prauserella shujinwangii]